MPTDTGRNLPGVDQALRDRVMEQIPITVAALDAAVASPTAANLQKLRDETDMLMRAVARILFELSRRGSRKGTDA
jgi:hypothetical protein